jgi:hypothetical protein
MEIPRELFIFSTIMFTVITIDLTRKAIREKTTILYTTLILTVLGSIWSILFVFDNIEYAAVAWISAMFISIFMMPELSKYVDNQIMEIDIESPLGLREFFTNQHSGWLKLANRQGVVFAILVYVVHAVIIYVAALLALAYFYGIGLRLTVYSLTIIPIMSYRLYKQMRKRVQVENPDLI